jgi:methyl-accepting chemotaxis protein
VVAEPYLYAVSGRQTLITSVVVPIMRDGQAIGAAGVDIELTEIQAMISEIKPFGTGDAGLYSSEGMVVASYAANKRGRNLRDVSAGMYGSYMDILLRSLQNGTEFFETLYSEEHDARIMTITSPFFIGNGEKTWSAVTIVEEATVMADVRRMTMILIILGVVILAVVTVIIFFVSRSITAPLKAMENVFTFIGDGDFTHSIEAKGNDEIGNIGRALNATLDKIKSLINVIKVQASDLAGIGTDLSSNMTETAAAINEITANIQSIKGRAINQSASVTQTNATMEQITINISKLNEQVDILLVFNKSVCNRLNIREHFLDG